MALKFLFDRNKMYVYPWCLGDLVVTKDIQTISPYVVKKVLMIVDKGFNKFYYDEESTNAIGQYFFDKIKNNREFYKV